MCQNELRFSWTSDHHQSGSVRFFHPQQKKPLLDPPSGSSVWSSRLILHSGLFLQNCTPYWYNMLSLPTVPCPLDWSFILVLEPDQVLIKLLHPLELERLSHLLLVLLLGHAEDQFIGMFPSLHMRILDYAADQP